MWCCPSNSPGPTDFRQGVTEYGVHAPEAVVTVSLPAVGVLQPGDGRGGVRAVDAGTGVHSGPHGRLTVGLLFTP